MFFNLFKKEVKPFAEGLLPVGSGHAVHYMALGNPAGLPLIRFHGGPGSRCNAGSASLFDLSKYCVVLFDQRGCGLSTFEDLLRDNTPQEAISDACKILEHLGIEMKNITVVGSSYGSTLALLFAEAHPEAVRCLLVDSIFLARHEDICWTYETSAVFYPDLMDEMQAAMAPGETILDGHARLLFSGNYEDMKKALQYYGSYERCLGNLNPQFKPVTSLCDWQINSFKIALDYERHNMYLPENEIMNNIDKIKHIPTLIIHNRLDMTCPINQAWTLKKALDNVTFHVFPEIGHWTPHTKKQTCKITRDFLKKLEG